MEKYFFIVALAAVILIFIEINGGAKKHGICGRALENARKM